MQSNRVAKNKGFTVLIGSCARKSEGPSSDVDIVRVAHKREIDLPCHLAGKHLSYIDLTFSEFKHLHSSGSLFLHHNFSEGILLQGDPSAWIGLTNSFRVERDFSKPIREYADLLRHLNSAIEYHVAYMPYLSNYFKAAKNIGIFKLAQRGSYAYDKHIALTMGANLDGNTSFLLRSAYESFERGCQLADGMFLQMKDLASTLYKMGDRKISDIIE